MSVPQSLAASGSLHRWVRFDAGGKVIFGYGKVEYGQGTATALAQIGAEELDVDWARVEFEEPKTGWTADEGMTVGSMSIESSGASVRQACAEVRALFLAHAADVLSCSVDELSIRDGAVLREGQATGHDYWSLAQSVDLNRPASGEATPKKTSEYRVVGKSAPRLDLPAKVFGAAFVHDILPEGVVHARVLRQPGNKAKLAKLDEAAIRKAAGGDIEILRVDNFVAFLSPNESAAHAAVIAAEQNAEWEDARSFNTDLSEAISLKALPETLNESGADPIEPSNRRRVSARYSKPYIAHGSMGPSCGVAHLRDGRLTIWTHAQGVYPMRQLVSRGLGFDIEKIDVIHAQGPGNYGHNGSDDAAFDAAAIALRKPGVPIRVQWRREDEFGYSPMGTAMVIECTAELDASGRIADYTAEVWSGPHVNRGRAIAEFALPRIEEPPRPPRPAAAGPAPTLPPGAIRFSGGTLNAVPSYDMIPPARVKEHVISQMPIRTSSLRGLGGPPNEYAAECFIDELAEAAGQDPLAYRLAMLKDPRRRAVLEAAARMGGWSRRGASGTGKGLGIAFSHHRNRAGLVAIVTAVQVETEVRLKQVWCAADCGLIINPDGARNQIEGGIVMGASWTLKEQVKLGPNGIESTTWDDYPILRFDEIPPIEIELLGMTENRPHGIGELSAGAAMGSIGNAVAHALGARIRDLPYTRERIAQALLTSES
jgi:CO/xanthine dehydrogenase Mo-binding subunit